MNKRSRYELHSACWIQQYEISSFFNDALSVRFMHIFFLFRIMVRLLLDLLLCLVQLVVRLY